MNISVGVKTVEPLNFTVGKNCLTTEQPVSHSLMAEIKPKFDTVSEDNGLGIMEQPPSKYGQLSTKAEKRLSEFGPNEIPEEKEKPIIKFLGYFRGLIPWMIEVAAILSSAR